MDDITTASSWYEINEYARDNHRRALELYDYIFPPWRWLEWWRRAKEVRRRLELTRSVKAQKETSDVRL